MGDNDVKTLCEALRINTSLKELSLEYNRIREQGAHTLSEALKVNNSLRCLYFYSNPIQEIGGLAFRNMLCINSTLTRLPLGQHGNGISQQLSDEIRDLLQVSRWLKEVESTIVAVLDMYNIRGESLLMVLATLKEFLKFSATQFAN